MNDAPRLIDGATVLRVASLEGVSATGNARHVAGAVEVADVARLAIARYEEGSGVYLLYCDERWQTITDTHHETIDQAVAQAEFEFRGVEFRDIGPYGKLSL